jgi:tetratricopeptide (TPR) repeat protein
MDAVTYPSANVVGFLQNEMVPVRVAFNHKPLSVDFNVKWTPTLVTLDSDGKEHHRTVGFLSPEELIPSLLLGIGKAYFDGSRYGEAIANFDKILAGFAGSKSAPEAAYYLGVATYKKTKQAKPLKDAYERLVSQYPKSEWAERAAPYRLIG